MFKFIKEDKEVVGYNQFPTSVEMSFSSSGTTWDDLLEGFTQFLRACGYTIPLTAYPTIMSEDGEDMRNNTDELWERFAKGEEKANEGF